MSAGANEQAVIRPRTPLWLAVVIAALFALFFAYDVWEALGNLLGMLSFADNLGVSLTALGWVVLIGALLLPIVLFGLAFWLGMKRGPVQQIALYLAALAVSAVLYLDIYTVFGPASLLGT
ncbi:MAG: hypothetical protein ABWY30_04235 [Microterricola sp.]